MRWNKKNAKEAVLLKMNEEYGKNLPNSYKEAATLLFFLNGRKQLSVYSSLSTTLPSLKYSSPTLHLYATYPLLFNNLSQLSAFQEMHQKHSRKEYIKQNGSWFYCAESTNWTSSSCPDQVSWSPASPLEDSFPFLL